MSPIRIGFIGLSTSGWAPGAHLPYLKQTSKYQIFGICNTSKASGEAAIKAHNLPASTKAYASPQELAADPDVDLVVVSVRTDRHGPAVRPALEAGKDAYVEWPLGRNLEEAQELAELARKNGVKTMVGLQSRHTPFIAAIKNAIDKGRIGRVLSSTVVSSASNMGAKEGERIEYFNDPAIGGNLLSIHFAHIIEFVLYAIGPLATYTANVSTQRPETQIVDAAGTTLRSVPRRTPDQMILTGTLASGGVLSMHQHGGAPFKGGKGLRWNIYGETGEIEVSSSNTFPQVGSADLSVRLHDHEADTVEDLALEPFEHSADVPQPGKNVAALYEAFAEGRTADYVDWQAAVEHHRLLADMQRSSDTGARIEV